MVIKNPQLLNQPPKLPPSYMANPPLIVDATKEYLLVFIFCPRKNRKKNIFQSISKISLQNTTEKFQKIKLSENVVILYVKIELR
jgi:hypothetical protein